MQYRYYLTPKAGLSEMHVQNHRVCSLLFTWGRANIRRPPAKYYHSFQCYSSSSTVYTTSHTSTMCESTLPLFKYTFRSIYERQVETMWSCELKMTEGWEVDVIGSNLNYLWSQTLVSFNDTLKHWSILRETFNDREMHHTVPSSGKCFLWQNTLANLMLDVHIVTCISHLALLFMCKMWKNTKKFSLETIFIFR